MGTTARTDDPIRAEVERRLTALADVLVARPLEQVNRLGWRVVAAPCRMVHARLTQPLAVVRSVAGLAMRSAGGDAATPAGDHADLAVVDPPLDAPAAVTTDRTVERPPGDDLPIAEYPSLAASQVVARLDGLGDVELDQVRVFEAAHRGRRTVLGKIDQLRSDR